MARPIRVYTGATGVHEVAERFRGLGFTVLLEGTEHVYITPQEGLSKFVVYRAPFGETYRIHEPLEAP